MGIRVGMDPLVIRRALMILWLGIPDNDTCRQLWDNETGMRILFVADGRSPIALNWIRYFTEAGEQVHLASTFACRPGLALEGLDFVPVAFSAAKRPTEGAARAPSARALRLRATIRHHLGPLTVRRAAARLQQVVRRVRPDLIHALRIPYEGMLAAQAGSEAPLLVSVWGNDFTLHAGASPLMRRLTRQTMHAAAALHADCRRDVRLAEAWGFPPGRPALVVPGNGGVRRQVFHPPETLLQEPVAINPRGFRAYVRNDVFFKSIPLVLERIPGARFLCAATAGEPQAEGWARRLGVRDAVELLAPRPHAEMGALYRRAAVLVSPATHDGTPNTLLEGMACGCLPVAGDLESIREWITHGENGLLFDPTRPDALAAAVVEAFQRKDLRRRAAGLNGALIRERAEYGACMAQAGAFYARLLREGA